MSDNATSTPATPGWAVDSPKSGAKLFAVRYDRPTDTATVSYDDGETRVFPHCHESQYGFAMIVERNPDGSFGQLYTLLNDDNLLLIATMIVGERRGLVSDEDIQSDAARAIFDELRLQFRRIGIPATYRRLGLHIMTHLDLIDDLEETLPFQLTEAVVARLEVGDAAFRNSSYLQ